MIQGDLLSGFDTQAHCDCIKHPLRLFWDVFWGNGAEEMERYGNKHQEVPYLIAVSPVTYPFPL